MFVKLYASMYDGTLARRGPWEALVTFQQLLILCDRFGVVDIHPEVISRRTLIPLEVLEKGIAHLLKPDPESRRSDEDGRRIVPIDAGRAWGWRIVNYSHYRSMRDTDERREYQRNYMRKKRAGGATPADAKAPRACNAEGFEEFYAAYPRKDAKKAAMRAWNALKPSQEVRGAILAAIKHQGLAQREKRFIPLPASFLNGERWNDEAKQGRDLGRCPYCAREATVLTKGRPSCDTPRCIDHAAGLG